MPVDYLYFMIVHEGHGHLLDFDLPSVLVVPKLVADVGRVVLRKVDLVVVHEVHVYRPNLVLEVGVLREIVQFLLYGLSGVAQEYELFLICGFIVIDRLIGLDFGQFFEEDFLFTWEWPG